MPPEALTAAYAKNMSIGDPALTVWERGRQHGLVIYALAALLLAPVAALEGWLGGQLGLVTNLELIGLGVSAALAVRPGHFLAVAMVPPVLLAALMLVVAKTAPSLITDTAGSYTQTFINGFTSHTAAVALALAGTLAVLAIRMWVLSFSSSEPIHPE